MTHQELQDRFMKIISGNVNDFCYFGSSDIWNRYYYYYDKTTNKLLWFSDPYHIVDSAFDPVLSNLTIGNESFPFYGWYNDLSPQDQNILNFDGTLSISSSELANKVRGTILYPDFGGSGRYNLYNSSQIGAFKIRDAFNKNEVKFMSSKYADDCFNNSFQTRTMIPFQKISLLSHSRAPLGYKLIGYNAAPVEQTFTSNTQIKAACDVLLTQISKGYKNIILKESSYYEVYEKAAPVELEYHLFNNKKIYYHNYTQVYYNDEIEGLHLSSTNSYWEIDANKADLTSTAIYDTLFTSFNDTYPGWEPDRYGNISNCVLTKDDFLNNNFENISQNFPKSASNPQNSYKLFYKPTNNLKTISIKDENTNNTYSFYYIQDNNINYFYNIIDETKVQYFDPEFKTNLKEALNTYIEDNLHLSAISFIATDGKRKRFIGFFDSNNNKVINENGELLINSLNDIENLNIKYEELELEDADKTIICYDDFNIENPIRTLKVFLDESNENNIAIKDDLFDMVYFYWDYFTNLFSLYYDQNWRIKSISDKDGNEYNINDPRTLDQPSEELFFPDLILENEDNEIIINLNYEYIPELPSLWIENEGNYYVHIKKDPSKNEDSLTNCFEFYKTRYYKSNSDSKKILSVQNPPGIPEDDKTFQYVSLTGRDAESSTDDVYFIFNNTNNQWIVVKDFSQEIKDKRLSLEAWYQRPVDPEQYFYINNNKIYWGYCDEDSYLFASEENSFLDKWADSGFIEEKVNLKGLVCTKLTLDGNSLLQAKEIWKLYEREEFDLETINKKTLLSSYGLPEEEENGFNPNTHYFYLDTNPDRKIYWQYRLEEYQDGDEIKTKKNTYLYIDSPSQGYNLLENEPLFGIPTDIPDNIIDTAEGYTSKDYEFAGYFTKPKAAGTRYFNDKMQLVNLITEKTPLLSSETEPVILYATYGLKGVPDLDFEIEDLDGIRAVQVGPYDPENTGNLFKKDYYKIVTSGNFDKVTANIVQIGFAVFEYHPGGDENPAYLSLGFLEDTGVV